MKGLGHTPATAVFAVLDDAVPSGQLVRWLEDELPSLNWRSHLFFVGRDDVCPEPDLWDGLARAASRHVRSHRFATAYLHPVVRVRSSHKEQLAMLERVLTPARAYQVMAYQEQGEARLLVLPIISAAPEMTADQVQQITEFLRQRFAEPSFIFCRGLPPGLEQGADGVGFRAYLDPGEGHGAGAAGQLWINHLLETLLERTQQHDKDLLAPCQRHRVVEQRTGEVFPCFEAWHRGEPAASMDRTADHDAASLRVPRSRCPRCMARAMLAMGDNLAANGRQREGRQVYFQLALALAQEQEYALAADLARRAAALSGDDRDRAAALIHAGLCRLDLGALEQAEADLLEADACTDDHAYVAFQRGRVQFAWRDYIEALERFEQALDQGSDRVPVEDLLYQMALCHINIEEYADARRYLLRHDGAEAAPVIRFYLGICDHGEDQMEPAMAHFREALRLGPQPEDLGRVLFYIGACLKELERFDEAMEVLSRAVEADPEDIANHNLLGYCYYKVKRHADAVACFRRCVEIDPRSGIDWANLGSNLRDLGRVEEAVAMYKKAVALDHSIGFAWTNLEKLENKEQGTRNEE